MNAIRKYYFPNICISFALTTLFTAINMVISNNDPTGYPVFIIELAAWFVVIGIADYFLDKINFKSSLINNLANFILNYSLFLIAGISLNWFDFRLSNIIMVTIIFAAIFAVIYYRSYKIMKQDEEWINRILNSRNSNVVKDE